MANELNIERRKQKIEVDIAGLNVMVEQAGRKEKYRLVVVQYK